MKPKRDAAQAAAQRLRDALTEAREGNYLLNGWYFYINRTDVETLVAYHLGFEKAPPKKWAPGAGPVKS